MATRIAANDIQAMFEGIDDATRDIIVRPLRAQFSAAIKAVNAGAPGVITPPVTLIMSPFRYCPSRSWRVVLIGQDPFPTAGRAHGPAFSTIDGSIQPSTRAMYNCLIARDLMAEMPRHGNLTKWARQGVLMINCAMTTLVGKTNAHKDAWAEYTNALIARISALERPLAFVLLGKFAHEKEPLILRADKLHRHDDLRSERPALQSRHAIIKWGHPSPLSTVNKIDCPENFVNADVFDRVNDFLVDRGDVPIDWDVNAMLPAEYVAPKPSERALPPPPPVIIPYDDSEFVEADLVVPPQVVAPAPVAQVQIQADADVLRADMDAGKPLWWPAPMLAARWNDMRDFADADPMLPVDPMLNEVGATVDGTTTYVFTDGAALANGKAHCRASWGFYVTNGVVCADIHGEVVPVDLPGEAFRASNNRGELEAIFRGLEFVRAHLDDLTPRRMVLVSDSEYALNCVNAWVNGWIAYPERLAGKKNIDLIFAAKAELDAIERAGVVVSFAHVRSHRLAPVAPAKGAPPTFSWFAWKCNDIADQLCTQVLGHVDATPKPTQALPPPRLLVRGRA